MAKASKKKWIRFDGWKNILTGLGVKGSDKREESAIEWEQMTEADADNLYAASDTAAKIVDEIVNDAFREGYQLKSDDLTPETLPAVTDEEARLKVNEKLIEAWKYARLYGGSAIVLVPNDITKLDQPFVPEAVAKVTNLLVLTRWELSRGGRIENDIRSPNFGKPITYRITPRTTATSINEEVHHTRILRFDGSFLPKIKYVANNYWHDSVLNRCLKPIRDYDGALSAISATLDDFSVAVMKIKGLTSMIAEDQDDLVVKRMQIANLSRSVARTIILDADAESYEYQDRQLSGVADTAKLIAGRLVVASGMPHTKILGESPDGSNATGNSTTKDWYDHVRAAQENYLDERLITLWKWIFSAKLGPTKGLVPAGLKAIYAPLWQEPEGELAKTRLANAQTDKVYIDSGVLDPAEVAVSRFGNGEYSSETQLMMDRKTPSEEPAKPAEKKPEPPVPGKDEKKKGEAK